METQSEFKVNIFRNKRDITNVTVFARRQQQPDDADENDDAKAVAILQVFSENSRANNYYHHCYYYTEPQKKRRNYNNFIRYGNQSIYFFSLHYTFLLQHEVLVLITKS